MKILFQMFYAELCKFSVGLEAGFWWKGKGLFLLKHPTAVMEGLNSRVYLSAL
jgi:hypothetical protein